MAKSKFADRLAGMQQGWDESQNQYDTMFGGVKIDAGDYIARVQSCKIAESKSSGKLMVRREHLIIEGSYKGSVVFDVMMLETPMGLTFLRRWFEQMGYNSPSDPAEIEDIVAAIAEEAATVKIAIKHSGEFTNVSVIEVLEEDAPEEKTEKESSEKSSKKETKEEAPAEEAGGEEDNAELLAELFAFCKAQDIDTEEDDTIEILGERISEYKWPEEELTDEENAMFEAADISAAIKKKAVSKKKKTKAKK